MIYHKLYSMQYYVDCEGLDRELGEKKDSYIRGGKLTQRWLMGGRIVMMAHRVKFKKMDFKYRMQECWLIKSDVVTVQNKSNKLPIHALGVSHLADLKWQTAHNSMPKVLTVSLKTEPRFILSFITLSPISQIIHHELTDPTASWPAPKICATLFILSTVCDDDIFSPHLIAA